MNLSNQQKDSICDIIRGLVGEFGIENVVVNAPSAWKGAQQAGALGPLAINYCTEDRLTVLAFYAGSIVEHSFPLN